MANHIYSETPIPVYPQPSFYETTQVQTPQGTTLNHLAIEDILERPDWDMRQAEARIIERWRRENPQPKGRHDPRKRLRRRKTSS